MTLTSFFAMFFMGNTSLYNQLVVRDMVSSNSLNSLLSTLVYILAFTLVIEGIGMLAIWGDIHGTMGMDLQEELAFSAFHAISAFCNAGLTVLVWRLMLVAITCPAGFTVMVTTTLPSSCTLYTGRGNPPSPRERPPKLNEP